LVLLADYYEQRERLRKLLQDTLMYPAVLVLLMLAVVGVLLVKVLPVFDEVYGALGASLSGVAGVMLALGKGLQVILPVICTVAVILTGAVFLLFCSGALRKKMTGFFYRYWGDRGVFRTLQDAHLAQVLAMGIGSGLLFEEILELAEHMFQNQEKAALRCRKCRELLKEGTLFLEAVKETRLLPESAARMMEIGMRSGNPGLVMEQTAARLLEEAEQKTQQWISRIEQILVLIVSVLVGSILLSVMLPLMDIMAVIG